MSETLHAFRLFRRYSQLVHRALFDEASGMLNLLAPMSCAFCGVPSQDDERSICVGCIEDMPWNEVPESPAPGVFRQSIAMLHYEFPADAAIKRFKFNRKLFYAPAFGEILCRAVPWLDADIDAVLPVPLHWWRQARRGFNQASEIAKPVAKELGVPSIRAVTRRRATPFQSGLGATERARNLRNAFVVRKPIVSKHVLLIDDVVTTGATGERIGKVLLRSGVSAVSFLALARAD